MVYNALVEQMDADEVRNLMRISPRTLRRDSMLAARGIRELLGSPRSRFAPAPARSPQGRGGRDDDRCQVQGCRAHATQLARVAGGKAIAVCARCREELAAVIAPALLVAASD
jgi:hypothetical protein